MHRVSLMVLVAAGSLMAPHQSSSAEPEPAISDLSPNERLVRGMNDADLCDWWVQRARDYVEAEIQRRKLFSPLDWQRLKYSKLLGIVIGDSKLAVTCAIGLPSRRNVTETARGISEQWVFQDDVFIYFAGDSVTAIQR